MNRTILGFIAALSLASTGCDNSTRPGGRGTLTATLVSPAGSEGAAVLDVAGPVESFAGSSEVTVFTTPSATGTRVVLVRLDPGVLSVRLTVPETTAPPSVTVVEVADGNDQLRADVSGYRVEFQ